MEGVDDGEEGCVDAEVIGAGVVPVDFRVMGEVGSGGEKKGGR